MSETQPTPARNKALRAGIAVAAGVALLAGAGGTFARWFDSESVETGDIVAGELSLSSPTNISWSEATIGALTTEELAAYRMVPGDVVTYSAMVTPTIVGENLVATLTAEIPDASGALADWVDVEASVVGGDATLRAADSGTAVEVRVVIELPFSTGGEPGSGNGTDAQTDELNLADLTISLAQNDRP